MIKVTCEACNRSTRVPNEYAGRSIRCPQCNEKFDVETRPSKQPRIFNKVIAVSLLLLLGFGIAVSATWVALGTKSNLTSTEQRLALDLHSLLVQNPKIQGDIAERQRQTVWDDLIRFMQSERETQTTREWEANVRERAKLIARAAIDQMNHSDRQKLYSSIQADVQEILTLYEQAQYPQPDIGYQQQQLERLKQEPLEFTAEKIVASDFALWGQQGKDIMNAFRESMRSK